MLNRLLTAGLAIATLTATTPVVAQSAQDDARFAAAQARLDNEMRVFRQEFDRYRSLRSRGGNSGPYRRAPEPGYDNRGGYDQAPGDRDEGNYDPSRYYRVGPNYQERVLSADDRVYSGSDGRYYCKRSDGTTGLIVGAAGGGILGNVIDGGRSRTVGTLLGAAFGAVAGRAVDQNNSQVRCR